jgi:hypothetical protein
MARYVDPQKRYTQANAMRIRLFGALLEKRLKGIHSSYR